MGKLTMRQAVKINAKHFLVDGNKPAANEKGTCQYIMSDGRVCGIGSILSPEARQVAQDYSDRISMSHGVEIDTIIDCVEVVRSEIGHLPINQLKKLQECHDISSHNDKFKGQFADALRSFCEQFKISQPKVLKEWANVLAPIGADEKEDYE